MGVGVVLYRVSLAVFSFHQTWMPSSLLSDDEERRFDPVVAQNVQDLGRVDANWPVVEGESDDSGLLRLSWFPLQKQHRYDP